MSSRKTTENFLRALFYLALLLPSIALSAQNRIALVIGNGEYDYLPRLKNPINDANDIANSLKQLGFKVIPVTNASLSDMDNAIEEFESELSPGSLSIIFYAGHGIQSKGRNYLIPTNENIKKVSDLRRGAVNLTDLLEVLEKNHNGHNIVFLDACRDNPLEGETRSSTRGLAAISREPPNTMIVYATQANATASDGTGNNGLFTKHLLRSMNKSLSLAKVIGNTTKGVLEESNNSQRPKIYTSFFGNDLSLYPGWKPGSETTASDEGTELWLSIMDSNDISNFEEYLRKFPEGRFASQAQEKIEELSIESTPDNKARFVFTSPERSQLIYKGRSEPFAANQTELFLNEGSNTFTLKMDNGRKIYGELSLNHIDRKVLDTTFGLDPVEGNLPKSSHIQAAMRGSPVQYRITMNTDSGVRQVINYRLSLRPIRK